MKLLIDANVLLDVLQNRAGFVEDSSLVWKLCETGQAEGIVSALTFANLVYVMRKELAPEKIEEVCKLLSLIFHFADFSVSDMNRAAEMKWKDFEDAIQSATAERGECGVSHHPQCERLFQKQSSCTYTGRILARL